MRTEHPQPVAAQSPTSMVLSEPRREKLIGRPDFGSRPVVLRSGVTSDATGRRFPAAVGAGNSRLRPVASTAAFGAAKPINGLPSQLSSPKAPQASLQPLLWPTSGPAVQVSGGFLRVSSDALLNARNAEKKARYSGIRLEANGRIRASSTDESSAPVAPATTSTIAASAATAAATAATGGARLATASIRPPTENGSRFTQRTDLRSASTPTTQSVASVQAPRLPFSSYGLPQQQQQHLHQQQGVIIPAAGLPTADVHGGTDREAAVLAFLMRLSDGAHTTPKRKSAVRLARARMDSDSSYAAGDLNATYQSVVTQIQEVNKEADDNLDFICKAYQILESTILMTVLLFVLMAIPLLMVCFGVKDLLNCPSNPLIPIYLLVGGSFGALKLFTLLWRQIRSRISSASETTTAALHHPRERVTFDSGRTVVLTDALLTAFLVVWFACGNYWTWRAWQPQYTAQLHDPSSWCDRTLYLFTVVHIVVCYALLAAFAFLSACLCCCRQICCYHDRLARSARAGLSIRTPV